MEGEFLTALPGEVMGGEFKGPFSGDLFLNAYRCIEPDFQDSRKIIKAWSR